MASLLFTDTYTDATSLCRSLGLPDGFVGGEQPPVGGWVSPRVPYLLGNAPRMEDEAILARLAPYGVATPLAEMCLTLGSDTTLALARLVEDLRALDDYALAGVGSAAGAFSARMQRFRLAVGDYEASMQAYWHAARWRSAGGGEQAALARQRMQEAGTALAQGFRQELALGSERLSARQRELLASDGRTPVAVREARGVARLEVRSLLEASRLSRLARAAHRLGHGLIAFEFVRRGAAVWNVYTEGGDWQREMYVEGPSFGLSVMASTLVTSMGVRALGYLVLATPGGWVLIIGGGRRRCRCHRLRSPHRFLHEEGRGEALRCLGTLSAGYTTVSPQNLVDGFFVVAQILMLLAFGLYGAFSLVTVRKLRRNPATRHALGVAICLTGGETGNVAQSLGCPAVLLRLSARGPLRALDADRELVLQHTTPLDRALGRLCFWSWVAAGVAALALSALVAGVS